MRLFKMCIIHSFIYIYTIYIKCIYRICTINIIFFFIFIRENTFFFCILYSKFVKILVIFEWLLGFFEKYSISLLFGKQNNSYDKNKFLGSSVYDIYFCRLLYFHFLFENWSILKINNYYWNMKIDCLCIIYDISKNWFINIVEIWMKITFQSMNIAGRKHMREKELTVERKRIDSSPCRKKKNCQFTFRFFDFLRSLRI